MTSFNEGDVNRAADGKFAAKTTSESDIDWNAYHEPRDIDLGDDDVEYATSQVDEDGKSSITAQVSYNFSDDIDPDVLNNHPVVAYLHVEDRFDATAHSSWDDPSEGVRFEMTSTPEFSADDEEAASNFYATTKMNEFKNSVNGGPVESLGKSTRRAYEMWGLDPDDESNNDVAKPDLSNPELRAYVRQHGYSENGHSALNNPTNAKVEYNGTVVPERSLFMVHPDDTMTIDTVD